MEVEKKNGELKHLGFVRIAAIGALMCVLNLYDYVKQNSGPLRSTVGSVEGAVANVVGPVYEKFKGVAEDLLVFLDKKVGEATHKFDMLAPPVAKQVINQAQDLISKASKKAQEFVNEVQVGGSRAGFHFAAKESKNFILTQCASTWVGLNHYPSVHRVADMALPTTAYLSEKYNNAVKGMAQKGYAVFCYLPLIPVDEIAKTFKQAEAERKDGTEYKSHSDSSDSD